MDAAPVIPAPVDGDDDDVAWALQTAAVQWQRGARADAVVWLRRAVDAAIAAGNPQRTQDLTRLAAAVADRLVAEALAAPDSQAPPRHPSVHDAPDVDDLLQASPKGPPVARSRASVSSLTNEIPIDFDADDVDDDDFDDDAPTIPPPTDDDSDIVSLDEGEEHDVSAHEVFSSRPSPSASSPSLPAFPRQWPRSSGGASENVPISSRDLAQSRSAQALEFEASLDAEDEPFSAPPAVHRPSLQPPLSMPPPTDEPFDAPVPPVVPHARVSPAWSAVDDFPEPATAELELPGGVLAFPDPLENTDPTPDPAPPDSATPDTAPTPDSGGTLKVDGVALDSVRGFEDLPEESQARLVRVAKLTSLSADEEVGSFGAALVTRGKVGIMSSVADVSGSIAVSGEVVFTRGTLEDGVPLRVVALEDGTVVASWSAEELALGMADCPWVGDELRLVADRFQALAGATLGLLGERLDDSLRGMVMSRLDVKAFEPGEIIVSFGKPVPGLHIVGGGRVELVDGNVVTDEGNPGDFLFAAEVLAGGKAQSTARAGKDGALILHAPRAIAHELLMSVPPLLEILAG